MEPITGTLSSSGKSYTTRTSWGTSTTAGRSFSMIFKLRPSLRTGTRMLSLGVACLEISCVDVSVSTSTFMPAPELFRGHSDAFLQKLADMLTDDGNIIFG